MQNSCHKCTSVCRIPSVTVFCMLWTLTKLTAKRQCVTAAASHSILGSGDVYSVLMNLLNNWLNGCVLWAILNHIQLPCILDPTTFLLSLLCLWLACTYHSHMTKALTASWSWSYVQNTSNRFFLTIVDTKSSRNQLVPSSHWTTRGRQRQIKCLITSKIRQELAGKCAVFHVAWLSGVNELSLIYLWLLCKTKPSRGLKEWTVRCSMSPG